MSFADRAILIPCVDTVGSLSSAKGAVLRKLENLIFSYGLISWIEPVRRVQLTGSSFRFQNQDWAETHVQGLYRGRAGAWNPLAQPEVGDIDKYLA